MPLWTAQYAGLVGSPSYLAGAMWHVHEMVFGYTAAVIAGFLMTAVRNWTSRPDAGRRDARRLRRRSGSPRGRPRSRPMDYAAAVLSVAFPLIVAAALAIPIVRSANRHNYVFIVVLVLLAFADLCFQLAFLGIVDANPLHATRVALDLILFVMTAISGRVVPMFTNNGIPGAGARRTPLVEGSALASVLALFVADLLQAPPVVVGSSPPWRRSRTRRVCIYGGRGRPSARRWCGFSMSPAAGSPSTCCCVRSRRPAWSRNRWPRTR